MKGFVFGKYLPFHLGHKALIDFALGKCTSLYVIVCASSSENTKIETRVNWIKETFKKEENIKIIPFQYNENEFPNTSKASLYVSEIWATIFIKLLPQIDVLITSEEYGEYVADFMGISHLLFDKGRKKVPISATKIRKSLYENWKYLPNSVKKTLQKKIIFSGTESTGKSSLSKKITNYYTNSSYVEEVGRQIISNSNNFSIKQLYEVAYSHSENIEKAKNELRPFVFIDTDIYTTQSYANFFFKKYLDIEDYVYHINSADIVFYLGNDLIFEQDGTRLDIKGRNKLNNSHKETLQYFNINYIEIKGNWQDRFDQIVKIIIAINF